MRPKVLIVYAGHKQTNDERSVLDAFGAEVIAATDPDAPEAVAHYGDCDALMVTVEPVSAGMMDRMPKCKIICRVGTGLDAIDIPAATARGIWVTNVPDYSIDEVSSHAMAFVLALARNLFRHREMSRTGTWRYQTDRPILRITGQTLGILGLGRIGSASARKARGLGFNVIAHDPFLPSERFEELGVRPVDFDTLMRSSDFVTLHVPLIDGTRNIIDARAFSLMKPSAFLVNTARGEVVDLDALINAVQTGQIAGAGIDVLPVEPPPVDHPILHEEAILVTPHIGWASVESGHDVGERGAQDVVSVMRGGRPKYPANDLATTAGAVS